MNVRLQGFHVRPAQPNELPVLRLFFSESLQTSSTNALMFGAFGQPGDIALGAIFIRPEINNQQQGDFQIFVREDCRRRGVGKMLIKHLYELALANNVRQLRLTELVHEDRPENAFCSLINLSPERKLGTYTLSSAQVLPLYSKINRRFRSFHPLMVGTEIVPLDQLDLDSVRTFFVQHFAGNHESRIVQLEQGYFNLAISPAAVRDGKILGMTLFRSMPDNPTIFLEIVLMAPAVRNSPIPIILLYENIRLAKTLGDFDYCAFEADEQHDSFASGIAKRCGAKPQWFRYRYAIDTVGMRRYLAQFTAR